MHATTTTIRPPMVAATAHASTNVGTAAASPTIAVVGTKKATSKETRSSAAEMASVTGPASPLPPAGPDAKGAVGNDADLTVDL